MAIALTAEVIKQFESDQREYGTGTALYNLLWLKAADDLKVIGVTRLKTSTGRRHEHRVGRRSAAPR